MSNSKPSMYLENPSELQKVFNRFDTNGDGKISSDELTGVLTALGSCKVSESEVAAMMNEIDTDKDGHINLDEFSAFCNGSADPYGSSEKELSEAFDMYDEDKDGKISAHELHKILTRLGENCSVEDCKIMIGSVDENGDGFVSFDEFKMMMTNNKNKEE